MGEKLVIFALLLPFIAFAAFQAHRLEVNPDDFFCHHQRQIKGDTDELFQFLTSPYAVEQGLSGYCKGYFSNPSTTVFEYYMNPDDNCIPSLVKIHEGSPKLFQFLLPWLSRFKEADKRIISTGKSYTASMWVPGLGEKRFYAVLTDYKPSKFLAFEFSDILRQRIVIQTSNYHDRTLLQTTVYFRRTSLVYHYTIGYALRAIMKHQLEKSMKTLAAIFESLDGPNKIPDFSRYNK